MAEAVDHVSELLSPYLDDRATLPERRQIEDHMEQCDACRSELADLRAVKRLLGGLPQRPSARSFALEPRRQRPAALSGTFGGFVRAMTSIAAAFLVVAVGLSLALRGLPRESPSVAAPAPYAAAQGSAGAGEGAPRPAAAAPVAGRAAASAAPVAAAPAAAKAAPSSAVRTTGAAPVAGPANAPSQTTVSSERPVPPAAAPINAPRLAGEVLLMLAGLAVAAYGIRWWRR